MRNKLLVTISCLVGLMAPAGAVDCPLTPIFMCGVCGGGYCYPDGGGIGVPLHVFLEVNEVTLTRCTFSTTQVCRAATPCIPFPCHLQSIHVEGLCNGMLKMADKNSCCSVS